MRSAIFPKIFAMITAAEMPTFKNQNQGGFATELKLCARSTHLEREALDPSGRGPGPTIGPWKLWVSRCSLVQSEPYFGVAEMFQKQNISHFLNIKFTDKY